MQLIREIDATRDRLHCSATNAWFRGQADSEWDLAPSLFRLPDRLDADRSARLSEIDAEMTALRSRLRSLAIEGRAAEHAISVQRHQSPGVGVSNLSVAKRQIKSSKSEANSVLEVLRLKRGVIAGQHYGERDAYIDWTVRAKAPIESSWIALAEMQHYQVPTRLLDWTDVLATGLFFALERYFITIELADRTMSRTNLWAMEMPEGLPVPCLWILNPYKLARAALGRNALLDPQLEPGHDYFQSFFVENSWPYRLPVPIYSRWRNPRIEKQSGKFTVHGHDRTPLNLQLGMGSGGQFSRRLAREAMAPVRISPLAAVYGVYFLRGWPTS